MATYATDLTEIANADDDTVETTWTELSGLALGGSPADDDENFIQGTNCQSQTTGTKSGLNLSIAYDNGSDISGSFSAGDCVFIWSFYAVGANLETYANGGLRAVVGASITAFSEWDVGGSDYGRNPYGGWQNVVVDPTLTADDVVGGGHGGAYQVFGMIPYTLAAISKGTPHAVDRIMYGRGEIYCTGTGCTFTGMAQENDYNDATNGYNRWGLFSEQGGVYLWKGLMSFGQSGTSATFSDSNKSIIIDDAAKTYAAFNKIEINNTSTSVTWTNISFTALGTVAPGVFEMVDNAATVDLTTCSFNGMGTFTFLSNADVSACNFNGCAQVDAGGASLVGSKVLLSTVAADTGAVLWNSATDPDTYLEEMTISKGTNAHHAIDFGTSVTGDITLTGIEFTGFGSTDDANDSTVRFLATSGSLTLSLVNCTVDGAAATTSNFSIDDAAGIAVTLSINPVTTLVNVKNVDGDNVENARVFLETAATITNGELFEVYVAFISHVSGTATASTTGAHGLITGDKVVIRGAQPDGFNKVATVTVTTTNQFTYSVSSSLPASATGTKSVSFVALHGLTDSSGNASASRTWGAAQQLKGWARKKNTSAPFYKDADIAYAVNTSSGNTTNVVLQPDE